MWGDFCNNRDASHSTSKHEYTKLGLCLGGLYIFCPILVSILVHDVRTRHRIAYNSCFIPEILCRKRDEVLGILSNHSLLKLRGGVHTSKMRGLIIKEHIVNLGRSFQLYSYIPTTLEYSFKSFGKSGWISICSALKMRFASYSSGGSFLSVLHTIQFRDVKKWSTETRAHARLAFTA